MASTQLAAAIGYPGSNVAFAQLLSGMERSGLIEREVRGKRTYRISLGAAHARRAAEAKGAAGRPVGRPGLLGHSVLVVLALIGLAGRRGWLGPIGLMGIMEAERRFLTMTSWPAACWYRWSAGWP